MPCGGPSLVLLLWLAASLTGCATPPAAPGTTAAGGNTDPSPNPPAAEAPAPASRPVRVTHAQILARLHAANRRVRPTGFNMSTYHGMFDWDEALFEEVTAYVAQAGAMQAVVDDLVDHAGQEERTLYNLQLATVVYMAGSAYPQDVRIDAARLDEACRRGDFEWLVRLHADEAWRIREPLEGLLELWQDAQKARGKPTPPA